MKRYIKILLAFLLVLTSGCANTVSSDYSKVVKSDNYTTIPDKTPLSILTTSPYSLNGVNDRVISELERRTQTKISFVEVNGDYYQSLEMLASTGTLPDIICMLSSDDITVLKHWLQNGWLKPFDENMQAVAPNIMQEYRNEPSYEELKWNGKIVYQPIWFRRSPYPNFGLIHVRLDILEQLELKLPETLDELTFCMTQMKDRLGIYGLEYAGKVIDMSAFAGAYGLPYNGWVKCEDGKLGFANVQPGMLEALKYIRGLYEKRLIDPDASIITIDIAEDRYLNGKAGFLIQNGGAHISRLVDNLKAINPNGKEWLLSPPKGPLGSRGYTQHLGFWGLTAISGSCRNPVEAAEFLDYLVSEEGQKLTCYGIEGIHYTEDSVGKITINASERVNDGADHWDKNRYHLIASSIVSWVDVKDQDFWSLYNKDDNYIRWYKQMYEVNQGTYQIKNEIFMPQMPSWMDFNPISIKLWEQYASQIILGKGDADTLFEAYVKAWYASGGADAVREANESKD